MYLYPQINVSERTLEKTTDLPSLTPPAWQSRFRALSPPGNHYLTPRDHTDTARKPPKMAIGEPIWFKKCSEMQLLRVENTKKSLSWEGDSTRSVALRPRTTALCALAFQIRGKSHAQPVSDLGISETIAHLHCLQIQGTIWIVSSQKMYYFVTW